MIQQLNAFENLSASTTENTLTIIFWLLSILLDNLYFP